MIKLPAGFKGSLTTKANEFRAVVISGAINYSSKDLTAPQLLKAGSYLESEGRFTHKLENDSSRDAIIYIRTDARYQVN